MRKSIRIANNAGALVDAIVDHGIPGVSLFCTQCLMYKGVTRKTIAVPAFGVCTMKGGSCATSGVYIPAEADSLEREEMP
jgi:hypothetical protein